MTPTTPATSTRDADVASPAHEACTSREPDGTTGASGAPGASGASAVLPSQELVTLVHALLRNADDLLADARLLCEHQRWARSYALAALAGEELGKVGSCLDALLGAESQDSVSFRRSWRDHGSKLVSLTAYRAAFLDDLAGLDLAGLNDSVTSLAKRKMSALYVDYGDEGQLMTPSDITAEDATVLLARVGEAVEHARVVIGPVSVDAVRAIAGLTPALEKLMDVHIEGREPEEALVVLREVMARLSVVDPGVLRAALEDGTASSLLGLDG